MLGEKELDATFVMKRLSCAKCAENMDKLATAYILQGLLDAR